MPPHHSSNSASNSERANSLGLDAKGLQRVLELLDRRPSGRGSSKRAHARKTFRKLTVELELTPTRGASVRLKLATRNLSCGGICVLHRSYMHTGTQCVVWLTSLAGRPRPIEGEVTRCAHLTGRLHEIGVRFKEPIALAEFIDRDSAPDVYSLEHVEPEQLSGSVVLLGLPPIQERIVQHHLRNSDLQLRSAADRDGWDGALQGVSDLVILDEHCLIDHGAGVFEGSLQSVVCPVLLLSLPDRLPTEPTVGGRSLPRIDTPINQENLLRAIGEFLIVQRGAGHGSACGVPADDELFRLVISDLGRIVGDTRGHIEGGDREGLAGSIKELTSAGQVIGLVELVEEAGHIAEALANGLMPDDKICTQAFLRITRVVDRISTGVGPGAEDARAA